MSRRDIPFMAIDERPPWTGPVERRDPEAVRGASVHLTARCNREHCHHWMSTEALRAGRCNHCHRAQH